MLVSRVKKKLYLFDQSLCLASFLYTSADEAEGAKVSKQSMIAEV